MFKLLKTSNFSKAFFDSVPSFRSFESNIKFSIVGFGFWNTEIFFSYRSSLILVYSANLNKKVFEDRRK